MPHNVTDLPKEVLGLIFKNLVPTMDGWRSAICPVNVFQELHTPNDLLNVMAVCELFYNLALPCAWRVAAISLGGNTMHRGFKLGCRRLRGTLIQKGQWEYLRENPHLAFHIRVLALEIFDDHPTSSPDLLALRSVIDSMSNLRVLNFFCASKNETIASICTSLIEKPGLRTVIMRNTFPAEPPSLPRNNLTHLNIQEWHPIYENFIRTLPCLQSLAFEAPLEDSEHHAGFVAALGSLPIPWATLRVLSLKWVDDWPLVLKNLSTWKISHLSTSPAPLSEITIDLLSGSMSKKDIQHLINCGQDLRALWIHGMPEIVEEATLNQIFKAFPRLQDLGMLTDGRVKPWGMPLPTLVRCLGKLPMLRRLHWNYIDEELDDDIDSDDDSDVEDHEGAMLDSFRRIFFALAPHCHALEKVTFNDEGVGHPNDPRGNRHFFHSFGIRREGPGRCGDYRESNISLVPRLLNKADWDFCSFDDVF